MTCLLPAPVLSKRLSQLQEGLRRLRVDCAMIRTLSDFKYLMGFKWLRPALLIPADEAPTAFVARGEEDFFNDRSALKEVNVITYTDGGDLMGKVSSTIRTLGAKRVGMVFSVERDSFTLFYEMFKKANRDVEVVDINPILSELRVVKDDYEIELIRKAGEISARVLEKTLAMVTENLPETSIAAEAYYEAYRAGSEEPHIYVNVGPHPRVHAEPMSDVVARKGVLVTVVVASDYNGYYANTSATTFIGDSPPEVVGRSFRCVREVYLRACELTSPGRRFIDVIRHIDELFVKHGLVENRLTEYTHGVGLQPEEYPVVTIVPAHRALEVRERMVLAFVHTPLMLKGFGTMKFEDTHVVWRDRLERVTRAHRLLEFFKD
ncbi:MAG: Xaa-Pro peptidase family protein [Zestosphaera sp.]